MEKLSLLLEYTAVLLLAVTSRTFTLTPEDFGDFYFYNYGSGNRTLSTEHLRGGRQSNAGLVKCPEPFEEDTTLMPTRTMCCKPNIKHNFSSCCPASPSQILIPGSEPGVDPSFGPFCCDPSNGYCCSTVYIQNQWLYPSPDPKTGKCCRLINKQVNCCHRPMIPATQNRCCGPRKNLQYPLPCCPQNHTVNWPIPSCCALRDVKNYLPEGFCCPLPYVIIFDSYQSVEPESRYKCSSPEVFYCELPNLPNYKSCIPPTGYRTENYQRDWPQYDQVSPEFTNADPEATVVFDQPKCARQNVTREVYGNPYSSNADEHSVPVNWLVTSPFIPRVRTLNETITDFQTWPEAIIPFIFPIAVFLLGFSFMIPSVFLGGICWAILYNLRFLGHKKLRMRMRSWLIQRELRRRDFQNHSIPPADLRKIRHRDRYQMPKIFQDSEISTDDEPEELRREAVSYKLDTNWTQEEIDRLGFDPDHIPLEWIYGDLIGKPDAVQPEVKNFNARRQRKSQGGDDVVGGSLDTEEWRDFIQNRSGQGERGEAQAYLNEIRNMLRRSRASRSPQRSTSTSQLTKAKRKKRAQRRPYKRKK